MTAQVEPAVVGVFMDRLAAENAVDALEQAGFGHHQIGYVIRGDDAVAGGTITDASGTKDGKGMAAGAIGGGVIGGVMAAGLSLLVPGVGPVLAGGILATVFGGVLAGTAVGGILGAFRGLGVSEHEAHFYQSHFHEGRAIVAIKAGSRAGEAADILVRYGGSHIHNEGRSPIPTDGLFHTP